MIVVCSLLLTVVGGKKVNVVVVEKNNRNVVSVVVEEHNRNMVVVVVVEENYRILWPSKLYQRATYYHFLKARLHDRKKWSGSDKKTNGSDKI